MTANSSLGWGIPENLPLLDSSRTLCHAYKCVSCRFGNTQQELCTSFVWILKSPGDRPSAINSYLIAFCALGFSNEPSLEVHSSFWAFWYIWVDSKQQHTLSSLHRPPIKLSNVDCGRHSDTNEFHHPIGQQMPKKLRDIRFIFWMLS